MSTTLAFDILAKDRASKTFDHFGNSVDKTGRAADKTSHHFATLGKVAKVGALAAAAAVAVAAKATYDMAKAAMDDQKAQAVLANTAKKAAGATDTQVASMEKWISAQGMALGVTDDELRPALGRLVATTHDVGQAQKLASLAMDVSAGSGKKLQTISEALGKAVNGNVGGLGRLGVQTKNADGSTKSLNEITKELSRTYSGAAAAAADTASGRFGRVKVLFDETKEAIGARLLPMLSKLAGWIMDDVVPAAQRLGQKLSHDLGPAFRSIGKFISEKVVPAFKDVAHFVGHEVVPAVKRLIKQVGPGAKDALKGFKDGFRDAKPGLDAFKRILKAIWQFIKNYILPVLGKEMGQKLKVLGAAFKVLGKLIGIWGKNFTFVWNKFIAPFFRVMLKMTAQVMVRWGLMLHQMAKVPHMGWLDTIANKMLSLGLRTIKASRAIKDIPTHKTVQIDVNVTRHGDGSIWGGGGHTATNASGGWVRKGTLHRVNEHGSETFFVPGQSGRILPHSRTQAMVMGSADQSRTTQVVINAPIHVDGAKDPKATAREIRNDLLKLKRDLGGINLGLS